MPCAHYAEKLDGWTGEIVLSDAAAQAACDRVPEALKDDIRFAHTNIRRFAEAQKATMTECEIEVMPGLIAGQKLIPVSSAGCYVPGGRYSHIASALMTITTAKVAGVPHITAVSPTAPECRHSRCHRLCDGSGGRRSDPEPWRRAGHCRDGAGPLWRAACRYSGRPRQQLCGRGQADAVWQGRHRHVRRANGFAGHRRCHRLGRDGGLGSGQSGRTRGRQPGLAGHHRPDAGRSRAWPRRSVD